jgi:CheY-like chemotaxis protein
MLQMQLSGKYNVYRAVNGVEGLKKVRQYSPDLIVTDQMMPEMTGMEMLQEIRKDFQISHIPVIMLTAKNDDATRTKAITLGANAFITKPFSKEHLEAQIAQLLAERRAFRERLIRELQKKSA